MVCPSLESGKTSFQEYSLYTKRVNIRLRCLSNFHSFAGPNIVEDIKKVKDAMHQKFRVEEEPRIYDPDSFEEFCKSVGCNDLFNAVVRCQSSPRQSSKRLHLNKIHCVAIIYRLCYGLSQWCNYFQKDFATNILGILGCHLMQLILVGTSQIAVALVVWNKTLIRFLSSTLNSLMNLLMMLSVQNVLFQP